MIVIDMPMPRSCKTCPLFIDNESPTDRYMSCKLIGHLNNEDYYNTSRDIKCPIKAEVSSITIK